MPVSIRERHTTADVAHLEPLLSEYLHFVVGDLKRCYGIEISADEAIASSMNKLDHVVPPNGATFAAYEDAAARGMVFLRSHGTDVLEIKRLYVQPVLRGTGTGRALAQHAVDAARRMGARRIILDSTRNLAGALALYESLGFRYCEPYPQSDLAGDPDLMRVAVFMELWLTPGE